MELTNDIRNAAKAVSDAILEGERLIGWADCLLLDLCNLKPNGATWAGYARTLHAETSLGARYESDETLRVRMSQTRTMARKLDAEDSRSLGEALDLVKATTGRSASSRSGKGKGGAGKGGAGKGKGNGGAGGNESKPLTVPDACDALDTASLAVAANPATVGKVERDRAAQAVRSAVVLALATGITEEDVLSILAQATEAAAALRKAS